MKTPFGVGVIFLQLSVAAATGVAVQLIWEPVAFQKSWQEYALLTACLILAIMLWAIGWPPVNKRLPVGYRGWAGAFCWVMTLGFGLAADVNGACAAVSLSQRDREYGIVPLFFAVPQIIVFGTIAWVLGRVLSQGREEGGD